jgi:ssDNA-specific exonuclease RecJ
MARPYCRTYGKSRHAAARRPRIGRGLMIFMRTIAVEVAPAPDADLSGYRHFIFLDTPLDYHLSSLQGKRVYVNEDICGYDAFKGLDANRETLLQIYAALRQDLSLLNGDSAEEVAAACDSLGFDEKQFIFALHVFEELGLVSFGEGRLTVYRGVKVDLADSTLYAKVARLQQD